jgi:hypothetical protein
MCVSRVDGVLYAKLELVVNFLCLRRSRIILFPGYHAKKREKNLLNGKDQDQLSGIRRSIYATWTMRMDATLVWRRQQLARSLVLGVRENFGY